MELDEELLDSARPQQPRRDIFVEARTALMQKINKLATLFSQLPPISKIICECQHLDMKYEMRLTILGDEALSRRDSLAVRLDEKETIKRIILRICGSVYQTLLDYLTRRVQNISLMDPLTIKVPDHDQLVLRFDSIHSFMLNYITEAKHKDDELYFYRPYINYLHECISILPPIDVQLRKAFLRFVVTGPKSGFKAYMLLTKVSALVDESDYLILTMCRDVLWGVLADLDDTEPETIRVLEKALSNTDPLGKLFWTKRKVDPLDVFAQFAPEQHEDKGLLKKIKDKLVQAKRRQGKLTQSTFTSEESFPPSIITSELTPLEPAVGIFIRIGRELKLLAPKRSPSFNPFEKILATFNPLKLAFTHKAYEIFNHLLDKLDSQTIFLKTQILVKKKGSNDPLFRSSVHFFMLRYICEHENEPRLFEYYVNYLSKLPLATFDLGNDFANQTLFLKFITSQPQKGELIFQLLTLAGDLFNKEEDLQILVKHREATWNILSALDNQKPETIITLEKAENSQDNLGKLFHIRLAPPRPALGISAPAPEKDFLNLIRIKLSLARATQGLQPNHDNNESLLNK